MTKEKLFASLKDIQWDSEIPADFTHIGNIEKVYPDYETNAYRTDIWENKDGIRIATWDLGNSHLSFMGDGSLEGFMVNEIALGETQSGIIATPRSSVHFPKNEAFDHLPEIYDWTFDVATSTDEGITICTFGDFVFPHGSYRVSYTPELGEITAETNEPVFAPMTEPELQGYTEATSNPDNAADFPDSDEQYELSKTNEQDEHQ